MAYFFGLILFFFPSLVFSQSAAVGQVDIAGWIKTAEGTYTKAFGDTKLTLDSPPQGVKATTSLNVNTSKGLVPFEISKTANVDVSKIGKSMGTLARLGGPVGLTLTAATLVCELTTICNQAGQWMMQVAEDPENPNSYPVTDGKWQGNTPATFPTASGVCSDRAFLDLNFGTGFSYDHMEYVQEGVFQCFAFRTSEPEGGSYPGTHAAKLSGCADGYVLSGSTCNKEAATTRPVTPDDWAAKESLMNDDRFIPELIEKGAQVPVSGVPTLTAGGMKQLGLDSVPTKDSSGNVTGRADTTTSIEAVDAGTSDAPGRVIIKETKTTINYDNSNTQISTSTSTSYSNQPQEKEPSQFTISFDTVPEATLPGYSIPNTFASDSWGSGTCPPDFDVNLINASFVIPTQPVCSTAEMINPFVLLFAAIASIYIISGVRSASAT